MEPLIQLQSVTKVFLTDEVETHALAGIDMVVGRPGLSPKSVKSLEGEAGLKVFQVPDTTCHWL